MLDSLVGGGTDQRWRDDNAIYGRATYSTSIPKEIERSLIIIKEKQEYLENCSDNSVLTLVQDTLKAEEDKVFHWVFDIKELGGEKWKY